MVDRVKVLLCANSAWSIANFRRGVIKALIQRGCEVHVVAPDDSSVPLLVSLGCVFHELPMAAKGRNPLQDVCLLIALWRLYRRVRAKVIFHYTIKPNVYGSVAAWFASTPSVAIVTGLGYVFLSDGLVASIAKGLYRFSLKFANEVWFLNEDDRKLFVRSKLIGSTNAVVLPGEGVDLKYFRLDATRSVPSEKGFIFLMVARLLWDKGVGEYIAAARAIKVRYPAVVFQLLGASDSANPSAVTRQEVEGWHHEGVVEYLGTTDDVRPAIANADSVVLPSYREGLPRVLLEAAAMERPLIATDVPGCREVVEDGVTGFLCEARSSEALHRQMEHMLALSESARREMGKKARLLVENKFDETFVVAQYLRVLDRV